MTEKNPSTSSGRAKEEKRLHVEIVKQMLTLATSGFGLVAALAWNSLIQELVNNYIKKWIPGNSGLVSLLIYALVVTVIAVFITLQLSHLSRRLQKESED
jgi:ABC-type phosphate transport system permease subunit